ncbi:facilitated trehalose transporter Tret1-like [Periplaneta americana]|uniref:facilitated trehalose transporter Tret1-like n=1 Tax=Periplaneta americana TaxID=6978 RepID=UPI0037E982DB
MAEASLAPQIVGALIAMLGGFTLGLSVGWSSPVQNAVKELNRTTNSSADRDNAETILDNFFWIASIMPLGACSVMFPVGFLLDRIGRKWIMFIAAPLVTISFIIVAVTFNAWAWIVGRFLMGFSSAAFCVAAPIYVGEITEPRIRGTLGVCFQLFLVIGIAVQFILGLCSNYIINSGVSAVFPIVFIILFVFMPETPRFLMMKDKNEAASKSLQWYRGKDFDISSEMQEIESALKEIKDTKVSIKDLFKSTAMLKSMLISLGLHIFQQVSGINVIMFYSASEFEKSNSALSPIESSIILGVVQIVGTLVSALVIDRVGRKLLLNLSFGGMAICLCAVGGWYIYLDSVKDSEINTGLRALPIIFFCAYLLFFSFGCGPIPWAMMGELFPKELKGICGSIAAFVNWGFAFIITVTFEKFEEETPHYVSFFIYAGFCVATVFFVIFIVIETKGKTLEEIEKELGRNAD